MATARTYYFGKARAFLDDGPIQALSSRKAQELLCALHLADGRPQHREVLANRLWGDCDSLQVRKYLRQAIWLLQTAIPAGRREQAPLLRVDGDWVQLNPALDIWSDTLQLQDAFSQTAQLSGCAFDDAVGKAVTEAVELYVGGLLEGCYQDWCILERERFRTMYLVLLQKLIDWAIVRRDWETGLQHGYDILRQDVAHEGAHYKIMTIRHCIGDRTGALRQFEACASALGKELGVPPSPLTLALYESVRDGLHAYDDTAATVHVASPSTGIAQPFVASLVGLVQELSHAQEVIRRQLASVQAGPLGTA